MKNQFDLTGKVAVVIGGGGGIGGAIAKGFAFYGADVVITGRTMTTLEESAQTILNETGKTVTCITADSTDAESITALKDAVVEKFGKVDILVNSQGFNKKFAALDALEHLDEWDAMYATNVKSMLVCCSIFAKVMAENHYGKIINISSIRGARAINGSGNIGYGSTKGAVDMLTKYLAGEWGRYGITVNAIGPIVTWTQMMIKDGPPPEIIEKIKADFAQKVPMGRGAEADDNIGIATFLASSASDYVTGQIFYPDGGLLCIGG